MQNNHIKPLKCIGLQLVHSTSAKELNWLVNVFLMSHTWSHTTNKGNLFTKTKIKSNTECQRKLKYDKEMLVLIQTILILLTNPCWKFKLKCRNSKFI